MGIRLRRSISGLRRRRTVLASVVTLVIANQVSAETEECALGINEKLTAQDAQVEDLFGSSVSVDSDLLVVGAPGRDGGQGVAYVFRWIANDAPLDPSPGQWVQEAQLSASDGAEYDGFGTSVSISRDRIVVGAPGVGPSFSAGAVYVFRLEASWSSSLSSAQWVQESKFVDADGVAHDQFGEAVSIDKECIVVRGTDRDDAGVPEGVAHIFALDENGTPNNPDDDSWVQVQKLTASDADDLGGLSNSVSISDDWIVIGARGGQAVYLFQRDDQGSASDPTDDIWAEISKLTMPDPPDRGSGSARVAIDGAWFVVGVSVDTVQICDASRRSCAIDADCRAGSCDVTGTPCHVWEDCPALESACMLPAESGPCGAVCPSFFYNTCTRECESFVWGCCGGNANRFESLEACEAGCPPDGAACTLLPDPGPCDDKIAAWFFNACSSACESFVYGGCEGNDNRYATQEECEAACPPRGCTPGSTPPDGCATNSDCDASSVCISPRFQECIGGAVCGVSSGSAHVYKYVDGAWVYDKHLVPSDAADTMRFGGAVAISGAIAVVGAHNVNLSGDQGLIKRAGASYVFHRYDNGTPLDLTDDFWTEQKKLFASDADYADFFGGSVAVDGKRVASGVTDDRDGGFRAGAVYVHAVDDACGTIPALSGWALAMFAGLLVVVGTAFVRRRVPRENDHNSVQR